MLSFIVRTLAYATYCLGYYSIRAVYGMLIADPSAIAMVLFL